VLGIAPLQRDQSAQVPGTAMRGLGAQQFGTCRICQRCASLSMQRQRGLEP
jgi:hypothetical protein